MDGWAVDDTAFEDMAAIRRLPELRQAALLNSLFRPSIPEVLSLQSVVSHLRPARVCIFGEAHIEPGILRGQIAVLSLMRELAGDQKLSLVMEMFAVDQQNLLDSFARKEIDEAELTKRYNETGTERFELGHYGFLLARAREMGVELRAGFVPRSLARKKMSEGEGETETVKYCREQGWLPSDRYLRGTNEHFAHFKSLITGSTPSALQPSRSLASLAPNRSSTAATATSIFASTSSITGASQADPHGEDESGLRKIFPAQIIKDASMAHQICKAVRSGSRVLAICGNGHAEYGFGVPERVLDDLGDTLPRESMRVICSRSKGRLVSEVRARLKRLSSQRKSWSRSLAVLDTNAGGISGESAAPLLEPEVDLGSETASLGSAIGQIEPHLADLIYVYESKDDMAGGSAEIDGEHDEDGEDEGEGGWKDSDSEGEAAAS
ncbi:hypothetical protein BJ742DRAFT_309696 [Cladochytrium replicatum]|nr:hypothetical protein BJ742DRAFT_309696 [Cladochytrium replicatum]